MTAAPSLPSLTQQIQQARYVSFATFRKTGAKVATPVWMAPAVRSEQDQGYFIFSAGNAGKVKRLRNNTAVVLACCDARGQVLSDWTDATAELVTDAQQIEMALRALHNKYGWQMWLADIGSKITGKYNKRAYIRVNFQPPATTA